MAKKFDIIVIGGGTGGYAAAFRARELGFSAAIIERDKLGGTCLHRGCIPTKSLLNTAELLERFRTSGQFGIHHTGEKVVFSEVVKAKNEAVAALYAGLTELAAARQVELVKGEGRLLADNAVEVATPTGKERIEFKYGVLATGSKPLAPPGMEVDGETVITSEQALELDAAPRSIVVLGGGYVGVEFASLWRSFGSEVTMVEAAPGLMLREDRDIAAALTRALKKRGIAILTSSKLVSHQINRGLSFVVETPEGEKRLVADKLLVAVGRGAVTDGLEAAGVATENGFVKVDERSMTTRPDVYAVGDLLATPQLAHAAFAEGIFVAETIAGKDPEPIDYDAIPHCVYSFPETAGVGLTEEAAKADGFAVKTLRLPFTLNSRARIAGENIGEAKVVTEEGGRVLGVHMIGARVTEMIGEAMLLVGWEAQPEDVARLIHPHPTFSEMLGEAAMKLAGKPLHVP